MSDQIDYGFLIHGSNYDPQKAREYYLRTRELKGRRKGSQDAPTGRSGGGGRPVAGGSNATVQSGSNSARLKAAAEARVNALEARLDKLREVLALLTKQAKARSGVEPEKDDKKEAGSTKGGKSKLTPAERKKAAERAAKYRKEHPEKQSPSQEAKDIEEKIADVKEQIQKMRAQLASASSKASNSKSQTASKGR